MAEQEGQVCEVSEVTEVSKTPGLRSPGCPKVARDGYNENTRDKVRRGGGCPWNFQTKVNVNHDGGGKWKITFQIIKCWRDSEKVSRISAVTSYQVQVVIYSIKNSRIRIHDIWYWCIEDIELKVLLLFWWEYFLTFALDNQSETITTEVNTTSVFDNGRCGT